MRVKSECKNENKPEKVLSLHGLHSLHGLWSAVCSLRGLRFGVTVFTQALERSINYKF